MTIQAEPVLSPGCTLGEGPFSISENELCWFDIFESCAYRLNIAANTSEKIELDSFLCCAGVTARNEIIAAGSNGIGIYDKGFHLKRLLFEPSFDTKTLRFNDGKVGPDGAFWAGVMSHSGETPLGMLLRITDRIEVVLERMLIPNGLGWSPDERTMYITDTGRGEITKWDFECSSGRIFNKKLFISSKDMSGAPDGLAVDSVGNVWSAFWGAGRLNGFRPSGEKFSEIEADVQNPTSCCFAGIDYSKLYITSAVHGVDSPGRDDGALFKGATGTVGKTPNKFKY